MPIVPATTIEQIREYEQVRTPDYALLANLVIRAKGPERAMAQFADDTQIGASTLSRIINMNIKKPLSIENIIKIYEARAREDDRMLLDSLARANGLFPKEYADRVKARSDMAARRNEAINRERLMKNALIAGVVASGLPVTEVVNTPRFRTSEISPLFPSTLGDFVLNVRSEANSSKIKDWAFYVFSRVVDRSEDDYRRSLAFDMRRIMERASGWFLIDAWSPEKIEGLKLSFVFADDEIFDRFIEAVKDAKLNNEMTAILIDPVAYQVVREVWIPGNYDCMSNISVFDVPAPIQTEDDFIEDGYYEEGDVNDEI